MGAGAAACARSHSNACFAGLWVAGAARFLASYLGSLRSPLRGSGSAALNFAAATPEPALSLYRLLGGFEAPVDAAEHCSPRGVLAPSLRGGEAMDGEPRHAAQGCAVCRARSGRSAQGIRVIEDERLRATRSREEPYQQKRKGALRRP